MAFPENKECKELLDPKAVQDEKGEFQTNVIANYSSQST
jgi:hypothetical protein